MSYSKIYDRDTGSNTYKVLEIVYNKNRFIVPFKDSWKGISDIFNIEGEEIPSINLNIKGVSVEDVLAFFFYSEKKKTSQGELLIADFLGDDKYLLSKHDKVLNGEIEIRKEFSWIIKRIEIIKELTYKNYYGSYYLHKEDIHVLSKHYNLHRSYKLKSGKIFNLANFKKSHRKGLKFSLRNFDNMVITRESDGSSQTSFFGNSTNILSFLRTLNPDDKGMFVGPLILEEEDKKLTVKFKTSSSYIPGSRYYVP